MTQTPSPDTSRQTVALRYALWAASVAWASVIFWFSSLPGTQVPSGSSELGHFGVYLVLGALIYSAMRASGRRESAAAVALIVASLYGVTDEFHQHFVPGRTPDVIDWGVDTLGAACGILIARTVAIRAERSLSPKPAETTD